jgi:hypothetical protein
MAEAGLRPPFKELDHRDQSRLQPAASLHVFGGQPSHHLPFPDSGRFRNGHLEIERTLEIRDYTARRETGVKLVPNSARIHQIALL